MLRAYRDAHPDVPRVLVGDLSRRHGGFFGARYHDDHLHVRLSPRRVNDPVAG